MSTEKIVLWDIDGTLANDSHRKRHFKAKDYARYFDPELMMADTLIPRAAEQFHVHAASGMSVAFATARRERNREVTERWLVEKGLKGVWPVFMRADDSEETPAQFKSAVIRYFRDNGYRVLFYEDDIEVYDELVAEFGTASIRFARWAL